MMKFKNIFAGTEAGSFSERFATEEECLRFLAGLKWGNDYFCRKCGHGNYCKGKTAFSRRCTRCKHDESATAHTPFHGCRMPLHQAFRIAYQVCSMPDISTYKLAHEYNTRQMTCWKLKKKIMECLDT